jgi:hypothetical protein
MAKKANTLKRNTAYATRAADLRRDALEELRKVRKLEQAITREGRAVERAADAANRRLELLASLYAERLNKVFVDRAAWDRLRDEHAQMAVKLDELQNPSAEVVGASGR